MVFQHLLHGLQRTRGVGTVFANLLEVSLQHVEHVEGVLVVLGIHVLLLVLDVGLHVLRQAFGQLGEVVDVVHGVEDTVDETLCELAHRGLFLQAYHLVGAFRYQCLQLDLVAFQPAQSHLHEQVGDDCQYEDIQQVHIPAQVEWCGDVELHADDFRFASEGIARLYFKGV